MATLPKLSETEITKWVGETSVSKGRPYYRDGSVFDTRRTGQTLKGQCQGSLPDPYRIKVDFGPHGIVAADCSCPVGGGGHCKHVAALLLYWLYRPDDFVDTPDPDSVLSQYTQAELVTLVKRMLERYPDLEKFLERQPPRSQRQATLKPETIQRQVTAAFRSGGDEWDASYGIASELRDIVRTGDEYASQGDWLNAVMVYEVVAQEVLEEHESIHDEEGEVVAVVADCAEGLGKCLARVDDPDQRELILEALFDIYTSDMEMGGVGISDEVPGIILEHATPDERREVAAWVREALPGSDTSMGSFRRGAFGGFLLDLLADDMDDETYLKICRESGRSQDLVERLLQRGRVEEAATDARQTGDYPLLSLVDLFVAHGHIDLAKRLIRERLPTSKDSRLQSWLKKRVEEDGDLEEALKLATDLFWQQPYLEGYKEIRRLANRLNRWENLRPGILVRLGDQKQHELLTDIYLDEGHVDQALVSVELIRGYYGGQPSPSARHIQVAQAAEESHPDAAIGLYLRAVDAIITPRNRGSYGSAAQYLVRVRNIYRRQGQDAVWRALIAKLRQDNKQLRALQAELTQAGL